MIAAIRGYVDQQVKKVIPDIQPWSRDVFGNNDVNRGQARRFYNLVIGATNIVRQGNGNVDETDITLSLYASNKRDIQQAFDDLYDNCLKIRNNITCYAEMYQFDPCLIDFEPISITPIEEDTNDKTIKIEVTFIVRSGVTYSA